ncbi:MAG: T9SS type A sorting domain-containing protein [bacterium]
MNQDTGTYRYLRRGALGILLLIGLTVSFSSQAQPYQTKQGGICFRVDNNPALSKLHQFDSLFSAYDNHFSLAITSWVLPLSPEYIDSLISLSAKGHEVMDNTPTHQTQFFNLLNAADTSLFAGNPGVDHFYQFKVCLKYAAVDTFQSHNEGLVNVYGNMVISHNPGEFVDLTGNPYFFALYLNSVNKVFLWYNRQAVNPADPDTVFIQSFWEEPVNLGILLNLRYHKLTQQNVIMDPNAVLLLGQRSLDIFYQSGIPRPQTWIHPAGQMPFINGYQIKSNLGDSLLYQAGSNYANKAYLCYNEFNPQGICQFGMQNDEILLENHSFEWNKHLISDHVAKHYLKISVSTFSNPLGGWNAFIQRVDSLLSWCAETSILVGTYSAWRTWLYDSLPGRVVNVFPNLNVDRDGDFYPDGYDQATWINSVYDTSDGVPVSGNCSFILNQPGYFCQVTQLAGLEKGNNLFKIWTKSTGLDTCFVSVQFSFPETGYVQSFDFLVDTTGWTKQATYIDVPDSISLVNIVITRTDTMPDTVRISGMQFNSAGFLRRSALPTQIVTQIEQFSNIDLYNLVIDTIYPPSTISWWVQGENVMNFNFISGLYLQPLKPQSFWTGQDTAWLMALSPDGVRDSCLLTYQSIPIEGFCPGVPVTITLLDTLENDFIQWTSIPFDSTISNPNVYNPTVNSPVTTLYMVQAISPLGPIQYDSIRIIRYPEPQPLLPADTSLCSGDSVSFTATGGVHYLWSTGDTTATIVVSPDSSTTYTVFITNQFGCSGTDSTHVTIWQRPEVHMWGIWPAYCTYDITSSVFGDPPGGTFSGPGLYGDIFYPDSANIGENVLYYVYTDTTGCFNYDSTIVYVYPRPAILPQPSDTICADQSITLNAGSGNDSYLWSNGVADSIVTVDTAGIGLGPYMLWVYVTKDGCVNMDTAYLTFVECPIGIEDQNEKTAFRIFPNPAGEFVNIESTASRPIRFTAEILNSKGQVLISKPDNFNQTKIILSEIPGGIYLLRISLPNNVFHYRVVRF